MSKEQNYVIVCAPAGSGLRGAIGKLRNVLTDADFQDVEDILCKSRLAEEALSNGGVRRPSNVPKWPEMYDITWNLSRSQIVDLWGEAVSEALHRLKKSEKGIKVLSCHLIYYGGRRDEFYSPINASLLERDMFKPSHILLLIDDVYDMYLRLCDGNALFDPKVRIPSLQGRIREDEGIDVKTLPPEQLASLCLEWQVGVMTHLLSWRHLEIVIAETLATQLKTNFMVWGTKQLTRATAIWLQKDKPVSMYLSHPISRPRRKFRETGSWHEVVGHFNELQEGFLKNELICIMPSAIDEYRIRRKRRSGTLALREPILEERWPLPAKMDLIMYSMRDARDVNHERVMAFKKWHFENRKFVDLGHAPSSLCERADAVLGGFERQIEMQISSRDHLFVSWSNGILIFRPLFLEGTYSSGVRAEIVHWKLLAGTNHEKRAAFIHFDEDVDTLLHYHQSDSERAGEMRSEIRDKVIEIISQDSSISPKNAEFVIDYIKKGKPSEMLDQAPIPPKHIEEIGSKFSEYSKIAEKSWLLEKLTGHDIGIEEIPEEQIAVWIFKNKDDFKSRNSVIANFLKNGAKPADSSLLRFDIILSK